MIAYDPFVGIVRLPRREGMERYTFQPVIHGAGGFAKVIRGKDNELDRDVAIKVMDQLATEFGQEDRERFRREARILAKLSHPNIPSIYDIQLSERHFLILFQFIEGKTLREILAEGGLCPCPWLAGGFIKSRRRLSMRTSWALFIGILNPRTSSSRQTTSRRI